MNAKLKAGSLVPRFALARVGGGRVDIGGERPRWQLLIVYRGRHSPLCKRFLAGLNDMLERFDERNTDVVAASADPQDRAEADVQEFGWRFAVGYNLSLDAMRALGAYISEPHSPQETDRPFAEPALFLITPQGEAQMIDVSNTQFSRPDLNGILTGIRFIQDRDHPPRGTLE